MKMVKNTRKVKVYGVDSTKAVRARLIEILMERVRYHKDKFIAPILHAEMQAMQIKKNGKVEHSDNSHDDQVFSYLHALYVWYDGKNLAENFGIRKSSLKTDDDREIIEDNFEDEIESNTKIEIDNSVFLEEDRNNIQETLNWVEKDSKSFVTDKDIHEKQYLDNLYSRNKNNTSEPNKLNTVYMSYTSGNPTYVEMPIDLYYMDTDEYGEDTDFNPYDKATNPTVQGNLADMFNNLND